MVESDGGTTSKPPRANPDLLGQEAAERALLTACASGRMPHAWLISGRSGVGKATLAFRLARFLFTRGKPEAGTLGIDPSHPVFHRVASGGHADLLTIERQVNPETGRIRKEIAVDDVRRIAPFLHLTAAEGGWRIVIIDGAEDMNRFGQNAVLKILEEPPTGAILLLLTDSPSALLPTIRSRCRTLYLPPLSDSALDALVGRYLPGIGPEARSQLATLAAGSIGRALEIAEHDGVALLGQFVAIAAAEPIDWPAVHALSDRLGHPTADDSYRSFAQLLVEWLARQARALGRGDTTAATETIPGERRLIERLDRAGRLERAVEVWEKVSHLVARSEGANLDRRLTVISAMDLVSSALN